MWQMCPSHLKWGSQPGREPLEATGAGGEAGAPRGSAAGEGHKEKHREGARGEAEQRDGGGAKSLGL